ncbi:MAG: hypothetical protein DSY83_08170, partial [Flavobacteriia bacterium]
RNEDYKEIIRETRRLLDLLKADEFSKEDVFKNRAKLSRQRHRFEEVRETRAEIITESSFADFVSDRKVFVIGSGAQKCKEIIQHPNFYFDGEIVPSAKQMGPIAYQKYQAGQFEDVAYFEPYYLKDFVLQTKKKS